MAYINGKQVLCGVRLVHLDGYDLGKQAAQDEFWDNYQDYGNAHNYRYAFAGDGWSDAVFKPKYDIICGSKYFHAEQIFYLNKVITEIPVDIDVTRCYDERWNPDMKATFSQCENLKTIKKIIVGETMHFTSTFAGCSNLENITFEGTIGNELDLSASPKLTHDSLSNIINVLKDTGYLAGALYDGVVNHNGSWAETTFSANGKFVLGQQYYIEYYDPSMNSSSGTYTAKELYVNGSSVIGCEISIWHPIGYDMTIDIYNGSEDNQLAVYVPETYDSYVEIKILGGISLKLGETNIAKLSDAEIALANNKGWRLE